MSDERTTHIAKHCPRCQRDTPHSKFDSDPGNRTGFIREICSHCGREVMYNKQVILR